MKPIGFEEGKKYPMVLEIHGGPHTMYSNSFFHEFQLLAAEGYVVLYTNPRGGHGYGQKFVDACRGDYGGKDYEDLMQGVDYALGSFNYIDKDRLVVTGGSYGGFMTNWIVGHTDRFKAAVTQRSISNWISFYGVSDIGYYFTEWQILGNAWDDVEKLWHHSPLKYVANIKTPLLILHSEKDYRCPIEQAEQLFIAIKRLGQTDTEFVRFPNSNHDLSRNGNPKLRIERLNRIVGWFNKYIK
jgi:dipeptidyl aminopeptidase/acylaminoacyl peptidase